MFWLFFSFIFLAVALPGMAVHHLAGKGRSFLQNLDRESIEEEKNRWACLLEATDADMQRVGEAVRGTVLSIAFEFRYDLDRMFRYYAEDLGLEADFRAIYGAGWRAHVRLGDQMIGPHHHVRWYVDGFLPHEQTEIIDAFETLLLSHDGLVRKLRDRSWDPYVHIAPRENDPYILAWYRRIEDNIRAAGHPDFTLYMIKDKSFDVRSGAYPVCESNMERKW